MEAAEIFRTSNKSPVELRKDDIMDALLHHDVVIIVSPTGSGKSTQVPTMLLERFEYVLVTQPRRVATESLARRVAFTTQTTLGDSVGFKTAFDSNLSENTRILYCTDGIEAIRQLRGKSNSDSIVYVIDEAHEWNMNLELLVAFFRKQLDEHVPIKLVILSATIDADRLADFFSNSTIIHCEGRSFPIEDLAHNHGVVSAAKRLLDRNLNVLVFVPGKREIHQTIRRITESGVRAKCLPFHADLMADDIEWIFELFDEPKCIVATTIAQTSLTIPDIDAVVDSGLERHSETKNGVSGLYTKTVSLAEREQRRGRAGRTKPGIYVDCSKVPIAQRDLFSVPAIRREDLSGLVLQLLVNGYEPEEVRFFHSPKREHIVEAKRALTMLGFIDDKNTPTKLGMQAAYLPTSVRSARMILEGANAEGVVDHNAITFGVLFDAIKRAFGFKGIEELSFGEYTELGTSDAFLQVKAYDFFTELPTHQHTKYGVDSTVVGFLQNHRKLIVERLKNIGLSEGRKHRTLDARFVVAGLSDCVFRRSFVENTYSSPRFGSTARKLSRGSRIDAPAIVGYPWNFEKDSEHGPVVHRIIQWATEIPS